MLEGNRTRKTSTEKKAPAQTASVLQDTKSKTEAFSDGSLNLDTSSLLQHSWEQPSDFSGTMDPERQMIEKVKDLELQIRQPGLTQKQKKLL